MLYAIALATEGWGVVASLKIYPPFAGAAVSAITLVVAFGFAVSRPCLSLKVRATTTSFLMFDMASTLSGSTAIFCHDSINGVFEMVR